MSEATNTNPPAEVQDEFDKALDAYILDFSAALEKELPKDE